MSNADPDIYSKTAPPDRPEWAKAATITRLLGPSRSSLYEAAAKGLIRTSSVRGRGKKRGSRFFDYESVRQWISSHATGGESSGSESGQSSAA